MTPAPSPRRARLTPLAAALVLALGACTTVRVEVPVANVKVPAQFHYRAGYGGAPVAPAVPASGAAPAAAPQAAGESLQRWWLSFNDPALTALIERGLQANTDIRVALDRVREARAYQTQAESAMYPTVEAGGAVAREKFNLRNPNGPTSLGWPPVSVPMVREYGVGLVAAWEVDIFGSRRSKADSVTELVNGAHEEVHGAQLLVAGDIAINYFEARGVEQRMEVLKRGIEVTKRLVTYATARYNAGQARRADVLRAQAEAEYTESQWAPLRMLLQHRLHRLATLTGQTAGELRELPPLAPGAGIPATLPSVLPSEVLENRPDVRGAAYVLRSRAAELGEAKADLFPKFYLGFLGDDGHVHSSGLPNGGGILQAIGLGVRLPIFNAGRLRGKIAVQDARLDSAAADYERAILQALEDVESAYVARLALDTRTTRLDRAVSYALESAGETEKLYQAGQELLQPALESLGKALQREDELVQSRTARATTTVQLYKAIGAGWSTPSTQSALAAMDVKPQTAKPQTVDDKKATSGGGTSTTGPATSRMSADTERAARAWVAAHMVPTVALMPRSSEHASTELTAQQTRLNEEREQAARAWLAAQAAKAGAAPPAQAQREPTSPSSAAQPAAPAAASPSGATRLSAQTEQAARAWLAAHTARAGAAPSGAAQSAPAPRTEGVPAAAAVAAPASEPVPLTAAPPPLPQHTEFDPPEPEPQVKI